MEKIEMLHIEAYQEINETNKYEGNNYTIYPKRFYKTIDKFNKEKKYDFCFIGAFKSDIKTFENRKWILKFI